MELPNLFNNKKTNYPADKLFIAVALTDSSVQVGLWQVNQDGINIIRTSSVYEYQDDASLLLKTDHALQDLGKASENVEDVVFGLEMDWVDMTGIVADKKPLLKKLTKELSLKPVGFVVMIEALFHFLIRSEPQLSVLLVRISANSLSVSVIERGNLSNTEKVGRSDDVVADLLEAVARIKTSLEKVIIPPKITIVSASMAEKDLKEVQQQLLGYDWKSFPEMVHAPTVDIMPQQDVLEAVIQEGGRAVAESQGYKITLGSSSAVVGLSTSDSAKSPQVELAVDESLMAGFSDASVGSGSFASDIQVDGSKSSDSLLENVTPVEGLSDFDDGRGAEFASSDFPKKHFDLMSLFNKLRPGKKMLTSRTATHHNSHPHSAKHANSSWVKEHFRFVIIGFAMGILALLMIGVGATILAKEAVVTVSLNGKIVSSDVLIILDPTIEVSDPENKILKADLVTKTLTGSKSSDTTGVKLVGDKASGTVSIVNKTDESKLLTVGTGFASGELVFVLSEEITVPAASTEESGDSETTTYGKVTASVIASAIGAESNLVADIKLVVGDFSSSDITATVVDDFSGGASREVRVFSKEDQSKILAELEEELIEEASELFRADSADGRYIVPTGEVVVESLTYDSKIGEEVRVASIDLELTIKAVSYVTKDIVALAEVVLADQVPAGFSLGDEEPSVLSQPSENVKGTQVVLDANISAVAYPNFDQDQWKQEIADQSPDSAAAILRGKSEVKEVEVIILPLLAKLISNTVPKDGAAVKIIISKQ